MLALGLQRSMVQSVLGLRGLSVGGGVAGRWANNPGTVWSVRYRDKSSLLGDNGAQRQPYRGGDRPRALWAEWDLGGVKDMRWGKRMSQQRKWTKA